MLSNVWRIQRNAPLHLTRVIILPRARLIQFNTNSRSTSLPGGGNSASPSGAEASTNPTESQSDTGVPLQFLSKPLGINEIPSALPKSWEAKREELLDRDRHMEKRRHLVKQVTRGYFHDFHKLKHHGGKMWIAPRVLIREDINLQENLLKSWLVSLSLSSLRNIVPPELQPTYLLSSQNMEYLRVPLGMENKHIGYTYLLDDSLKIRWAGCGFARPEESQALANCTRVLLDRLANGPMSQPTTGKGSDSPKAA